MTDMNKTNTGPMLDVIDNFPAYGLAGPYLKQIITENNFKLIADIGGGANPMIDDEFILKKNIRYFLIDNSAAELKKANSLYNKIEADAAGSNDIFQKQISNQKFDFIFSHMFLEHIEDPMQAHRNFYSALNPGGRCVHIYPSPNNLPLVLNRLLPESMSTYLVRIAQPARNLEGSQRKFKGYYRMCGAPTPALRAKLEEIGFIVRQHTGFIGHNYYDRFQFTAMLERRLRRIIHRLQLPLTSGCLLALEKPV
jgi:SAM-dependent methyltransferase